MATVPDRRSNSRSDSLAAAKTQDHLWTNSEDRYAIEREIGRGGMASVYLARDLKHQRSSRQGEEKVAGPSDRLLVLRDAVWRRRCAAAHRACPYGGR